MKRLFIYGCGVAGKYIYENIKNSECMAHVAGWIDNFLKAENSTMYDLPIYMEEEFRNIYRDEMVLVCIQNKAVASERIASLLSKGITNIYIFNPHAISGECPVVKGDAFNPNWMVKFSDEKPVLDYLEYQVVDHCNLKCRGCSHYSNIVSFEKFADIRGFEEDLLQLKSKFSNIATFRLMGGEPLLNDELDRFIMVLHRIFPLSNIHIVSNGLRIPKISLKLIHAINLCSVTVDISQYPPTAQILPSIVSTLEKNSIKYHITPLVKTFHKTLVRGNENYENIFFNHCIVNHQCKFLRNGQIYICAQIPLLFEMKEYFDFDISTQELEKNGIALKSDMTGWDILCRLQKPFSLCRFCSSEHSIVAWKNGKSEDADIGDWLANISK